MQPRLDYTKASPGTVRALFGLEVYLHGYGLEHGLLHLVKLRASQINGCAYCIDMHSKDARASMARPSSASTCSTPGASPLSTPTASAPRWPGPRR